MVKHLPNAPITEAVIDFQVKPKKGLALTDIEKAFSSLSFGYYIKGRISEGSVTFGQTAEGQPLSASSASSVVGLRLHSQNEKYVLQVRCDRFTLSRLPPYEDWDSLIAETKRLWALYLELLAPVSVVRIATRFINNLRLPMHEGDLFKLYINEFIDVPQGIPQAVESFLQRFQLSDPGSGARVILTLALNELAPDGIAPVILDIDAFKLTSINPTDNYIWDELAALKDLKNASFFQTLTQKAVELYR
jgi:uncharacterized protein (TIGR04255 family)